MAVFIYIATTQGPVRVQAITEEDAGIKSVVCLDGMPEPLAISDRYHDFVKKGSGMIHRIFGHGSYRVDVDKPIDHGSSWQLGLYSAHVLHQKELLCNRQPKEGDRVYFVTGAIKTNGEVTAVEKVTEKFQTAAAQIQQWHQQGCVVACILAASQEGLPDANELDVTSHLVDHVDEIEQCLELDEISTSFDVLDSSATKVDTQTEWPIGDARMTLRLLIVGVLIGSIIGGFIAWHKFGDKISQSKAGISAPLAASVAVAGELDLSLVVDLADTAGECQQTQQQKLPLIDGQFQSVSFERLCAITYRSGERKTQTLLAFSLDRLRIIQLTNDQAGWQIPLPLQQASDRNYVVIAVYDSNGATIADALKQQVSRWNFNDVAVSLMDVSVWLGKFNADADVYGHVLERI
ncbi:MAG: hypothetical protein COA99_11410 [Moraxellaceae bacterium]|nr:MAG: hypothetical protein COA99_11410 [Moraxellaceae bacterium]